MPTRVRGTSFENSPRLDSLFRAGKLYLSLDDAIAPATLTNGPAIPLFDPTLTGGLLSQHISLPEANSLVAGTPVLTTNATSGNAGVTQGFSTGTSINASFNSLTQSSNSSRSTYN